MKASEYTFFLDFKWHTKSEPQPILLCYFWSNIDYGHIYTSILQCIQKTLENNSIANSLIAGYAHAVSMLVMGLVHNIRVGQPKVIDEAIKNQTYLGFYRPLPKGSLGLDQVLLFKQPLINNYKQTINVSYADCGEGAITCQ